MRLHTNSPAKMKETECAVFLMATYGEGEPTGWLTSSCPDFPQIAM